MNTILLNGVAIPERVSCLADADPVVGDLVRRAVAIDFDAKGTDLRFAVRNAFSNYHVAMITAGSTLRFARQWHTGYAKAAAESGNAIPGPFRPSRDNPVSHVRQLVVAMEVTLQNVADAIGGDQEEASDLLERRRRITPRQREGLLELLAARPQYPTTDEEYEQLLAAEIQANKEKLCETVREVLRMAETRRPKRSRGRSKSTPSGSPRVA